MKRSLIRWTAFYSFLVFFTSIQAQTSSVPNKIHSEYLRWLHEKELSATSIDGEAKDIQIPAILSGKTKSGKDLLGERSVAVNDSLALVALYNYTNGSNWVNHTNWLTGPVETWYGIWVVNGRVIYIDLNNNNLSGTIPNEIGNLSNLYGLILYGNLLTGIIPPEIGNLPILENLYLSSNQLTGSIPPELGNLTHLKFLHLSSNQLYGIIPSHIGNLVNLQELSFGGNYLTGPIPGTMGSLSNLRFLNLGANQITGNIPNEIGNLSNLQDLLLFTNQIDGEIPTEICNLPKLESLYLSANQLTGNIPQEIGNLSALKYLIMGENNLTGNIPTDIRKLSNLEGLDFSYNNLSGSLPAEIGELSKLYFLGLRHNQFTGNIPVSIGNLIKLTTIFLSSNYFSGNVPPVIGSLTQLQILFLDHNEFTGEIPMEFRSLVNLVQFSIANCRIENLPELNTLASLNILDIASNKFTFEDIEPNIGIASSIFNYAPQDSIGEKQNISISEGDGYSLSVSVGGEHNVYQWYKDNNPLSGKINSTLYLANALPEYSGVYTCQITNSIAPQLALYSRPITVSVPHVDHFIPVWLGNGLDQMNFYALSAKIDGINMKPGDEIGIFDGDACVGAGTLSQELDGSNIFEIRVSRDEPSTTEKDGYTPGNTASFKLWDASGKREFISNSITYISGSNIFEISASTWFQIGGYSQIEQPVSLQNGWNIFSLYVTPYNISMMNIVQPLIDEGSLVKIQNEAGGAIEAIPGLGIWIDNIGNWSKTEGYKIRVNKTAALTVTGIPLLDPVNIDLQTGWNIMGYPASSSQHAMTALNGLITANNLLKVQDESGSSIEPLPLNLGWIDNIGDLDPGEGYKIRVAANCTLTVTPPAFGSLKSTVNGDSKPLHFKNSWEGNGYDHMNVYLTLDDDNENKLQPGDEIGIFDGTSCVGSTIITDPGQKIHSLIVSEDDPITWETDGFVTGNTMSFKIWRASENAETTISSINYLTGYTNVFEPLGTTVASIRLELSNGLTTSLGDNYPNPFNTETTIPYSIGETTEVDIAIYNMLGQRVKTLVKGFMEEGLYFTIWDGTNQNQEKVSVGIYLCRLVAGERIFVKNITMYDD